MFETSYPFPPACLLHGSICRQELIKRAQITQRVSLIVEKRLTREGYVMAFLLGFIAATAVVAFIVFCWSGYTRFLTPVILAVAPMYLLDVRWNVVRRGLRSLPPMRSVCYQIIATLTTSNREGKYPSVHSCPDIPNVIATPDEWEEAAQQLDGTPANNPKYCSRTYEV
jgi:hypothetical protein